jgi:MFS family permease
MNWWLVVSYLVQALLADVAPAPIRDVTFAFYFTLAFGVGSLWVALYGAIIDVLGEMAGLPIVFGLMAASFLAAAVVMLPVRDSPREPNRPAMKAVESV